MNYLPNELIYNIISFVNNIELRIKFRVINKLKLLKFFSLSKIMRKDLLWSKVQDKSTTLRYNLFNYEKIRNRKEKNVDNDILEIDIEERDNKICYNLHIFRLKKKPHLEFENLSDIYYDGIFEDKYFWDYNLVKFIKY